ncbi:MAG: MFS transporter [Clostridiales bacterium]|nr:MFS transporter [Candidatus Blautia equi]
MNAIQKEQDYTARYSLLPCFYWAAFCSIISYASFYLLSIGYKNSTIGMIIAVAGAFSAILQPVVASYADRADSLSLKNIVLLISGVQIGGYIALALLHQKAFLLTGIIYGVEIGVHQVLTPLINSLGTETINQGKKLNYGISRSLGSVSYAVVAFILGQITVKTESSSVLYMSILMLFLLELSLLVYPFRKQVKASADTVSKADAPKTSGFAFFLKYKRFSVLLIGCVLIYLSHVMINNFTLQIVQTKGGDAGTMGTGQAIASLIELPTMFLFGWMLKKAECKVWFKISGLFFFLKIFATWLAPNVPVFYGVQFLQMFGWALITVSSVYYVNSVMEDQDKIKGQAYFTMTYTIGCVFGSLLGGALLEAYSANAMLICGSVCALIGSAIMFITA